MGLRVGIAPADLGEVQGKRGPQMWGATSTAIRVTHVSMSTALQGQPGCLGMGGGVTGPR